MNTDEIYKTLVKTDPFEILAPEVLAALAEKVEVKTYAANTYVFKTGTPSLDVLFIIHSGLAETVVVNDKGSEMVIGLRRPYDFFGETVVLSQQCYPGAVRAKEKLVCCLVHRKDLEKLIYDHPEFCGFFNVLLAERMRLLYEVLVEEHSKGGYSGISQMEPEFFKKRVSEVMAHPPITCRVDDRVTAVSNIMADRDISAIVALDRENRPRGILTEKNLVKYLIAKQTYPVETCRVDNIMYSNLVEISPHAFIGQALVAMMRSKTKNLIVMERGNLVGVVTLVDLIKTQSTGTLLLTKDIESQPDVRGLAMVSREIDNILNVMIEENASAAEIFNVMSELYERMTRRVIQLSEERMKLNGWGPPPVEYCFINMGSAARYEQALPTDQDNAIVYADPEDADAGNVDAYFKTFAEFIVEALAQCGVGRYGLEVMADNPKWRRSLGQWMMLIDQWMTQPDRELDKIIGHLFDFRPVWGNMALGEALREKLFQAIESGIGKNRLGEGNSAEYHLPISYLGTFITERGGPHKNEMNLRASAILPMVNGIRRKALANRIIESSTLGRLAQLADADVLSEKDARFFQRSFEDLMMLNIRENLKELKQGKRPDDYIDPYSLRKRERVALKDALAGVSTLLDMLREE
ncbi:MULTISPECIES: DUF294 nucleotidyltransferase-like domain-containing protein [Desulfococcus]|uniref:Putative CBS domain and cyclic nucleotide-regulated nucleotidyltransferase n=1 Tax=Desulfococcus multivorans DSM 2059 TaxID=1121405 RepID=S7V2V5_DESML|nr:DUF294 nucleotidyltransferase-like domain-containing protein [Desulfococcus multivorans]AOY57905.1 putative CBS domain and cyclic nucleotide-regulated nucleotidyltransferase [Desulfococcus multivorans]AQV00282.1 hypothetical protein B2D07_05505 [Desulfococcus multivorans]EPR38988.1 putative CBS domain and cyclic nucleotide-regulated nucleotidyltransferase [Desulfococcus multivorans DSM 2059]SJZ65686.1 CBS domain-containing protein [Desulfococcus multivorans DSM 2059]